MTFARVLIASLFAASAALADPAPQGITIDWRIRGEPLVLHSAPWFAGAISSIKFRGVEFLNSSDHGRALQGAIQLDGLGECLNPTLAGSSKDPPKSTSSELVSAKATERTYESRTKMAFWTPPGEPCTTGRGEAQAANRNDSSNVVYQQKMTLGYRGLPNAVLDRVTFTTDRPHKKASVEALTGYMPPDFNKFLVYDPKTKSFTPYPQLSDKSPEVATPVVVSTADGKSAMGAVGLTRSPHYLGAKFPETSKWSVVYHVDGPYRPGAHSYECVWVIGTLDEVEGAIKAIVGGAAR